MFDVFVVGGGLAGGTAALAARKSGASVALASRSWGATAMSTGALDIACTPAFSPRYKKPHSVKEHVLDIIAHRPRHPYGILGQAQVEACVQDGCKLIGGAIAADLDISPIVFDENNRTFASSLGALVPAAAAFRSHCGFDAATAGSYGILKVHDGEGYFDADRVARGVQQDAQAFFGTEPRFVSIPTLTLPAQPFNAARALDDEGALLQLIRAIKPLLQGCEGLLCPPVLGLHRHQQVMARLHESLGVPVVETVAHLPSVPGVRLQLALQRALHAAGVHILGEVTGFEQQGQTLKAAHTSDNLVHPLSQVVLASGRFISGGVVWGEQCKEALLGLPVVTEIGPLEEDSPHNVVREKPMESHPLMTAGVRVTRELQPMVEGHVAFGNLFAAGMIIGGFASRYALCADGVALATGWLSGTAAARHAMRSS